MHGLNNIKNRDSAGTCFGETDFEGEKFKYPGENSVRDITVHKSVYLAGFLLQN
jgi:hypothetical protein